MIFSIQHKQDKNRATRCAHYVIVRSVLHSDQIHDAHGGRGGEGIGVDAVLCQTQLLFNQYT